MDVTLYRYQIKSRALYPTLLCEKALTFLEDRVAWEPLPRLSVSVMSIHDVERKVFAT